MQKITVCKKNSCTGCTACISVCKHEAIKIEDNYQSYNALIDAKKCINCNACHKVCQNNSEIKLASPLYWYQGWASDETIRKMGSSGGIATAIAIDFIKNGGEVCSCCFKNGEFIFEFASKAEEVSKFTGSKYVKSNPEGIYIEIKNRVKEGKKVLFIGLPCQVAAVKKYVGDKSDELLYTCDLICHGTPSPKLLEDFLNQKNISLKELKDISFRTKTTFGLRNDFKPMTYPGSVDRYLLAFLCGLDYTDNCYECRFAGLKRNSDLTIGDAWGSELDTTEQKKGISVMICLNEKGKGLIDNANISLFPVDLDKVVAVNDQLRHPSEKTEKHNIFFRNYSNGDFNHAVFCSLPQKCIRQRIKAVLLKLGVYPGGN